MKRGNFWFASRLALLFLPLVIFAVSCGGGGGDSGGSSSTGTVNTSISDPPTCQTTFPHVWVTITRVRAHTSGNAGESDSGWIDLLDLRDHPKQIDLMNLSQTGCLLTQLGSTSGIPAGQYQQIRLYLLSNTAPQKPNNCDTVNGFNCVVTSTGTQILELSSEVQTGIKIPSGQIAGGKFVVPAGKVVDLNIDFDACSSIVQQPNGQFRLKPVLHAAELSLNNSISGTVLDKNSGSGISGAVVFLEQKDLAGIDRMIMQTTSKSEGTFIFCPVPAGSFDVVADALVEDLSAGTTTVYNATITLGVPSGTAMGNIPLIPETVNKLPAEIRGQVTTSTGSAATQADVSVSALQTANTILVTIPLLGSFNPNNIDVITEAGGGCPPNTDCAEYALFVPASNPLVGTFTLGQLTKYDGPAGPPINYTVNAQAADCSSVSPSSTGTVPVQPGVVPGPRFDFTGCQ